jgi:hypothetical protein
MAVAVAACGPAAFPQPPGTVAVNYTVDDSANKVFTAGQLEWKGSLKITPAPDGGTWDRKIAKDSNWGGPWPKLYDDGPWSAGGHEPAGATAGDHKWGVTVFATPPATGSDTYEYGTIDATNGGWLWVATPPATGNGTFQVAAGATTPITAAGLTLAAFGTTDLKLVVDSTNLLSVTAGGWDLTAPKVKGSAWGWVEKPMTHVGTTWTFLLSSVVGTGTDLPHSGLLKAGDKPEWVFVFGTEYKDTGGAAAMQGVTAFLGPVGTVTTPATITLATNKNTIVTVP